MNDVIQAVHETRDIDREEARLMTGMEWIPCLERSVNLSSTLSVGVDNEQYVCLFGVVPAAPLEARGEPWLIGSSRIEHCSRAFARQSKYALTQLAEGFEVLENYVYTENRAAVRWLEWLGFDIDEAKPIKPYDALFHHFSWRAR